MEKIKYSYALKDNKIFHINEVKKGDKQKYLCISCGNQLIPRKGEMKQHHFAHKQKQNCSPETYLHKLAKEKFIETYLSTDEYNLEYDVIKICTHYSDIWGDHCQKMERRIYPLSKEYPIATLEKKIDGFIPDILLQNKDNKPPIFVEIAVTHKCSEEKIKLGTRIIEIEITSEKDLEIFESHIFSKSDERITFFNFKTKREIGDFCNGKCSGESKIDKWFLVYRSQKCILENISIRTISAQRSKFLYYKLIEKKDQLSFDHYLFIQCLDEAYYHGIKLKNCFLCRYHATGKFRAIFCKTFRKECASSEAINCERFRYAKEYLETSQKQK